MVKASWKIGMAIAAILLISLIGTAPAVSSTGRNPRTLELQQGESGTFTINVTGESITVAAQEEDPFMTYGVSPCPNLFMIHGHITDANGNPLQGYEVIIKKQHNLSGEEVWYELKGSGYMSITNESGYYSTGWCRWSRGYRPPYDNYRMYINGELVDERYIGMDDWETSINNFTVCWKYQWNYRTINGTMKSRSSRPLQCQLLQFSVLYCYSTIASIECNTSSISLIFFLGCC